MMKINKFMPFLAGTVVLSVTVAPLIAKAGIIHNGRALVAQAQENEHGRGERGGHWAKLNLSDAQKQQLRQIEQDTRKQIEGVYTPEQLATLKAAREQHKQGQHGGRRNVMKSLDLSDAQKAQIRQIREAQKAQMDGVLTDAQKQQLQQERAQWQQKRQQRQQQQQ